MFHIAQGWVVSLCRTLLLYSGHVHYRKHYEGRKYTRVHARVPSPIHSTTTLMSSPFHSYMDKWAAVEGS